MKTLKQLTEMKKNGKPESTFYIEPDSTTALVPRSKDEKRFYDKHIIAKKPDANGNGDDVFNASNIKSYDRSTSNHGYNTKQDQAVYEGRTLFQILGEKTMSKQQIKKRSEIADAIARDNPNMPTAKKFRIATAAAMKEDVESVQESDLPTSRSRPKSVMLTHKTSGKEISVIDTPESRKKYAKLGFHPENEKEENEKEDKSEKHESFELKESDISEAQYNKHFNHAKKLLDEIADAMDQHSANVSNKENTPGWHHVDVMKDIHERLSSFHNELMRHVDYSKPLSIRNESIEDLVKVFDPASAEIIKEVYDSVNQVDKDLIEELIITENYDDLQRLLDEIGQE